MTNLFSPDIKPGEKYPWSYTERTAQMGTFGPASIAQYGGYVALVLVAMVVTINAVVAFFLGRTWLEGVVFAAVAVPLSTIISFTVVTYPYFAARRPEDAWMVRRLVQTLVLIAWVASTAALFDHVEGGLAAQTFHELFHEKQEAAQAPLALAKPQCAYFVPRTNAESAVHAASERLSYVKSWCNGWTVRRDDRDRACSELPRAQRAADTAERELACTLQQLGIEAGSRQAASAQPYRPHWTLKAVWNLFISALAMGILQVGGPILLYVSSEGGKGIMLERFDTPLPTASPIIIDVPGNGIVETELENAFQEWCSECVEEFTDAKTPASVFWAGFSEWWRANDIPGEPSKAKFEKKFKRRYEKYFKPSDGSKYYGIRLRE